MTWTTPDGQRAAHILSYAGLLEWERRKFGFSRFGVGKIYTPDPIYGWVRAYTTSDHEAACILRDAARRYISPHNWFLWPMPSDTWLLNQYDEDWDERIEHEIYPDYDAALIAAVIAVEGDVWRAYSELREVGK